MQTIIYVFSKAHTSLRDWVVNDPKLDQFDLVVSEQKQLTRPHGWAKLHMRSSRGAINIEWHAASQTLICRVVTRGGKSHDIGGAFIRFLLARSRKNQIASIHIQPSN